MSLQRTESADFVYADTDSVKSLAELDFTKYNNTRIKDAKRSGAWANDANGNPHYMGVFEYEGKYDLFRTLGAKRYCTVTNGKLEITVAGVPKKKGSEELVEKGGIEAFTFDLVFEHSGKTASVYNDDMDEVVEVDGHELRITRNVVIVDVEYSMTAAKDYSQLLDQIQSFLDKYEYSDYNKRW